MEKMMTLASALLGYVLGARAGRPRYEQILRSLPRFKPVGAIGATADDVDDGDQAGLDPLLGAGRRATRAATAATRQL